MKDLGNRYYPYVVVTLTAELSKELREHSEDYRSWNEIEEISENVSLSQQS